MKPSAIIRATAMGVALAAGLPARGQGPSPAPVTPNASPEARALLAFLQAVSGRHTLTGQHNYPNALDASTREAAALYGKTPAVFGLDFGFAAPGDSDAAAARPRNVAEAIERYRRGAIITYCWHEVRPTDDEPVTFDGSIQGRLTDRQWEELTSPGTALHRRWCAQVDVIAGFLKQLQAARVPVLWRPLHEMNGDWFWWGGRPGPRGSAALFRLLFDRLVHDHGINNLVWEWNVDRPTSPERQFSKFFPGADVFDVASLDAYDGDFAQSYYEGLLRLAGGKPIALAELAPPPAIAVLERQPRWAWWMVWAEMVKPKDEAGARAVRALVRDPRSWSLDDPAYLEATAPIRAASGRPGP